MFFLCFFFTCLFVSWYSGRMTYLKSFFLSFIVVALLSPLPAKAQDILAQFEKELPIYTEEFVSQEQFEAETNLFEEMPFKDKNLGYSLRLPRSWTKSEQTGLSTYSVGNKILGEIAQYNSEARLEERSRISIQVLTLDRQMSALNWFMQYAINKGLALEGVKEFSYSRVEALHVEIKKDISYAVRTISWITGNRLVFVEFHTPFDVWGQERALQSQIMADFKLTSPAAPDIEELKDFYFLDIAQFQYPKSWELNSPKLRSIDEMGAQLINNSDIGDLDGKIDVKLISAYSDFSLEEAIEQTKEDLKKSGLEINDLMAKKDDDFKFDSKMKFGVVDVYNALSYAPYVIKYELWMAIMADDQYFYFVTLLTPSRKDDFFVWSQNVEAFKLVVANTRAQEQKKSKE
jgi:hypothetical protein